VAQKADIVFEITANDKSSQAVWKGRNGILAGATSDKVLIASATLSIDWVDELIRLCKKDGFTFFDMALTGGRIGAESGALTLLCGGDEKKLEKIKPTLSAIATKVLYFGSEGKGMRYKLILNFIQATHIVAFGQAMKIAKAYEMDTKKVGDALAERPGGVITSLAWRDYQSEPNPINFSIEWITKDLTYAKKMVKDIDVKLLKEVLSEYQKAIKKGFAKKDWASVNTIKL
jgi:3-hydroxyisobutyrate dehydrogenase-like beta-hydroxyacid dehydrogenase